MVFQQLFWEAITNRPQISLSKLMRAPSRFKIVAQQHMFLMARRTGSNTLELVHQEWVKWGCLDFLEKKFSMHNTESPMTSMQWARDSLKTLT